MKATKAQIEARVTELLRIRNDGARFWDIREYVREKEQEEGSVWELADDQKPLSDSQIWRYIARGDEEIVKDNRASRKKARRRHLAKLDALFAKAVSQGDIRAAAAILRDIAELRGFYPAKKTEVTGKGGTPLCPSFDAIVAAFIKAEQGRGPDDAPNGQPRSDAGDSAPGAGSQALP